MNGAVTAHSATPVKTPVEIGWVRLVAAVILPIGPAAVAVLRFVLPYYTVDDPAAMAAGVAGNPGSHSAVLWLGLLAAISLVPAVVWVGGLTYRLSPRLTAAALALAVPGYAVFGVILSSDAMMWAGIASGLDPLTVGALVANAHPAMVVGEAVFVLGHLVGTVLLGIALWRTRWVPVWAAILVTFSQPVHLAAAVLLTSRSLDLAAWMMMAVGFGAVGLARHRSVRP